VTGIAGGAVARPVLTDGELGGALDLALDIISRIGLEIRDDELRAVVARELGAATGARVTAPRARAEAYLAEWRRRVAGRNSDEPQQLEDSPVRLRLSVMPYSHTYLDPRTGRHVPLTAARAVEGTRFLSTFPGDQLASSVPGHPVDVPASLQPLFQYKTAAQYNPQGGGYGWLGPPRTAQYVLQMAEEAKCPITATVVYVDSPLRLGGHELRTAYELRRHFQAVHVGNMGSCGATLPLHPRTALALSWAEAMLAGLCIELLTELPTYWGGTVEPFDLRAQTIPFGAPEQALYYRMGREASAWLSGTPPRGGHAPLLTMAKAPGTQAALEKGMSAALGVAWGCTSLGAAGSLSADEVFSPAQVVLDLELRDWLDRVVAGIGPPEHEPTDALGAIRKAVEGRGFTDADATLDGYAALSWFPGHLRREMLGRWRDLGSPSAEETARREAVERIESAQWRLPEPGFGALEAIYADAAARLV